MAARISAKKPDSVKTRSGRSKERSSESVFPNGIAILRRSRGVSQRHLAEKLGVKPRQVRRIEAGDVDIPITRAVVIADFLDVSLDPLCRRKRSDR